MYNRDAAGFTRATTRVLGFKDCQLKGDGSMSRLRPLFLLFALLLIRPLTVPAQDFGSGWSLSYFDSLDLSGTVVASASADRIDFDFTSGTPPPSPVNADRFSLRAFTQLQFDAGTYRFRLGSDDGARLIIDGQTALDRFVDRAYTEDTVDVFLPLGQHTIQVEYFQNGAGAQLLLNWEKLSDDNQVSPTEIPATPGPTPIPIPAGQVATGQVLNAEGLSVRSGPYLGASRLDIIAPGTEYSVFARNNNEGIYTWYLIEVQDFIEVADDVNGGTIRQPTGTPIRGWASGRYFVVDTPDANIPATDTVFETIGNPAPTGVQGILRSNMRLRQGPSYRTPTLQILDWGAEVEIVGRTIQARDNHWFQVIYQGQVGWLFAPFITINGDINSVPTY
jgi:hypothetical protein